MKEVYNITCNTDDNYAQHCVAMLCSLFENNPQFLFRVFVLVGTLSDSNQEALMELAAKYKNEIRIIHVDETKLEGLQYRKNRPLTKAAYYRLLLASTIDDDVDKILYLDCDMIVLGDVSDLFRINLDGYALAATLDCIPYNSTHRNQLNCSLNDKCFCSGIMMVNLKYWRQHKVEKDLIDFSKQKRNPVILHDQDSLNFLFKDKWFEIPPKWNYTCMSIIPAYGKNFDKDEYAFAPKILHYSSALKPWFNVWFPEKKYYVEYLKKSGFKNAHFIIKSFKYRLIVSKAVTRFYVSKYIYPFVPDILHLLIADIQFYTLFIFYSLFKPSRVKKHLLNRWAAKHKVTC